MGLPIAFAGAAVSKLSKTFKKPTARTYGKLPGTLIELQEGVEGRTANLNNRTYNDVETVNLLNAARGSADGRGIWQNLLPTWNVTPAALARIKQLDPSFQLGVAAGDPVGTEHKPSALDVVLDPIREGLADSIQLAAAGAGTLGARAVAPAGSTQAGAVNIPTDVKTLRNIAIGAAGLVLVVVVVVSLRR